MKEEDAKFNTKLKKGSEDIRNLKMTPEEKSRVFYNILSRHSAGTRTIPSPYSGPAFFLRFSRTRLVYQGLTFCLMVLVGGGMALASRGTLPGNILYPLKVNVVEPIHGALLFSPEAKIQYHGSLATERLIEAEKLKSKNELDQSKAEQISELLKIHTEDLNQSIVDLKEEKTSSEPGAGDDTKGEDAVTDFEASMKAHAKILDILNQDENGEDSAEANGINEGDANVPEAARASGEIIRKNLDSGKGKDAEQYEKRKDSVRSLIDSTDTDISSKKEDSAPDRLMILDNTEETLKKARMSLEEADEESKKGNLDSAYNKLLESESSAKEAGILLKEGFRFGNKKDDGAVGQDRPEDQKKAEDKNGTGSESTRENN